MIAKRFWAAAIVGLTFSSSALAAEMRAPVIVTIDARAAMMAADEAKARIEKARTGLEADKKTFNAARDALAKLEQQYQRDAAVMSADQKSSLQKQIEDKRIDLASMSKKFQNNQQYVMQEIQKLMFPKFEKALKAIIDEKKYDMVISREAVPFVTAEFDITKEVVERINATK